VGRKLLRQILGTKASTMPLVLKRMLVFAC